MKKNIIFYALFVVFLQVATAQTSEPEITQVSVNEVGGVTLVWKPNTSDTNFDHSEVWYRHLFGTGFQLIPGSESPYSASYYFEYPKAHANTRQTDYYVVNIDSAQTAYKSEVVSAIFLTACYEDVVTLSWNLIHLTWNTHPFYIYRNIGGQDWELLDSTFNTTYQDNPIPGFKDYSYRVYYKDKSDPSSSSSNITNPISYTVHQPITPSITSVYVNKSRHVVIEWEKSPSLNVVSYIIYKNKPLLGWDEIGRTNSPDSLSWEVNEVNLLDCETSNLYAVAAMDNCMVVGTAYPDSAKSTLAFYMPQHEICDRHISLQWEPCTNIMLDRYDILVATNDTSFVKITEVASDITNYQFSDLQQSRYCFKIQAVHERGIDVKPQTVTSCPYCFNIHPLQEPSFSYVRYVSVLDNTIQICFEVDTTTKYTKYLLERSAIGFDGPFTVVDTINPTGQTTICAIDSDSQLKTENASYYYVLNTIDSCGYLFPAVNQAQSILLTAVEDENHHANLEWSSYEGFPTGFDHYIVYRYINKELDNTFSVITTSTSYTDIDLLLVDQTKSFSYRVAAISLLFYTSMQPDTAYSNIATLQRPKSDIRFPNAFTPVGKQNCIFRPIYAGLEIETYEFIIFDRYGAAIFATKEPGGGWDGKINGKIAASGGYGYMLKILQKNGDRIERRGSMILIN